MSGRDSIAEILARAGASARPAAGPERALAAGSHARRRAAILAEIDETMLARALDFRLGAARLTVEARGRRLLRITGIEPAEGRAGELRDRLDAGKLTLDAEASLLAELIHLFAASAGELVVTPGPTELPPSAVDKGHGAAELAAAAPEIAAGEDDDEAAGAETPAAMPVPATGGGLRALLNAAGDFATAPALADADGEPAGGAPDGATRALASELSRGRVLQGLFLNAAIPGAKLIVLDDGDAGDALCLATGDPAGAVLAARIPAAALGPAVAAWRAALG